MAKHIDDFNDLLIDVDNYQKPKIKKKQPVREKTIRKSEFGEQTEKLLLDVSSIVQAVDEQKTLNSSFAYKDASGNVVVNINGKNYIYKNGVLVDPDTGEVHQLSEFDNLPDINGILHSQFIFGDHKGIVIDKDGNITDMFGRRLSDTEAKYMNGNVIRKAIDENGNPYYVDSFGHRSSNLDDLINPTWTRHVDPATGRVYYTNEFGDEISEETYNQIKDSSNVWIKTKNGYKNVATGEISKDRPNSIYHSDEKGVLRDKDGNSYTKVVKPDGTVVYVDKDGNEYTEDEMRSMGAVYHTTDADGNSVYIYRDENGNIIYETKDGKFIKNADGSFTNINTGETVSKDAFSVADDPFIKSVQTAMGDGFVTENADGTKTYTIGGKTFTSGDDGLFYDENGNAYTTKALGLDSESKIRTGGVGLDLNDGKAHQFIDENGNVCFVDENGNVYHMDENGNLVDENGNILDAKKAKALMERAKANDAGTSRKFTDKDGNEYYIDKDGNVYRVDKDGNLVDEHGNVVNAKRVAKIMNEAVEVGGSSNHYVDENGVEHYVDENGNVYTVDKDGNLVDKNGNILSKELADKIKNGEGITLGEPDSEGRTWFKDADGNMFYEKDGVLYNADGTIASKENTDKFLGNAFKKTVDKDGNVWYEDEDGNKYYKKDGVLYNEDGTVASKDIQKALGDDGSDVVTGTHGSYTVSTDADGNELYTDKDGNVFRKNADGTFTDVSTGQTYTPDEMGIQTPRIVTDKEGRTIVTDKDGNTYIKGEDGYFYDKNGKKVSAGQLGLEYDTSVGFVTSTGEVLVPDENGMIEHNGFTFNGENWFDKDGNIIDPESIGLTKGKIGKTKSGEYFIKTKDPTTGEEALTFSNGETFVYDAASGQYVNEGGVTLQDEGIIFEDPDDTKKYGLHFTDKGDRKVEMSDSWRSASSKRDVQATEDNIQDYKAKQKKERAFLLPHEAIKRVDSLGYSYSKSKLLIIILACMLGIFLYCRFLDIMFVQTVLIMLISVFLVPTTVYFSFAKKFQQSRFDDVNAYMEQSLYSFRVNRNIEQTLRDLQPQFVDSQLRDDIVKADKYILDPPDEILEDFSSQTLYKNALNIIADDFDCVKIRLIHKFMISVSEYGGNFDETLEMLLSDRAAWEIRQREIQARRKNKFKNVLMSIIMSLVLLGIFAKTIPSQYDISTSGLVNWSYVGVFIAEFLCYVKASRLSLVDPLKEQTDDPKSEIKAYNKITNWDDEKEHKKAVKWALMFLIGTIVMTIIVRNAIVSAVLLVLTVVVFNSDKIDFNLTYDKLIKAINLRYPAWIVDLALLLQNKSVQASIAESYDDAPMVLQPELEKMMYALSDNPDGSEPYMNFFGEFKLRNIQSAMKMLYSIAQGTGGDIQKQLAGAIERNNELLAISENEAADKNMAGLAGMFLTPVVIGSVQLMADLLAFLMITISSIQF